MGIKIFISCIAVSVFSIIAFLFFISFYSFSKKIEPDKFTFTSSSNASDSFFPERSADSVLSEIKQNENMTLKNEKIERVFMEGDNLFDLFKKITLIFKDSYNMSSHFEEVYLYLEKNYDSDTADFLFSKYREFVKCSQELSQKLSLLPVPRTKNEVLERIDYVEAFRKEYLGERLYSSLYKDEAEIKKFYIEKNYIIKNKDLYAYEKQELLEELKNKYEVKEKEKNLYEKYMEALFLNEKDFSEMSDEEIHMKKDELKNKYFSEDAVERREALQMEGKDFERAVSGFNQEKEAILNSSFLNPEEKKYEIDRLKEQFFSEGELQRFERTEKIKKERQKMIEKYGLD
ncbi:MAG: lipase secretion chaperone [Desulfobacteraceae bacterium]